MQHFLGNLRSGRDYTGGCRRGSGKAPALRRRLFFKLKLLTGEKFSSGNHTNDISVTLPDRRWTAHINVEYIEPWTSSIAGRQHRRDAGMRRQKASSRSGCVACCLPMVWSCGGWGAGTGATCRCLLPPSANTAVSVIKVACFQSLVNEKSVKFIHLQGRWVDPSHFKPDSDVTFHYITWLQALQGIYFAIYHLEHFT